MQDISDEILIKAAEGDLESFELIYKATAGFVYHVAFRVTGNKQDAEEVMQEVFLTVSHKLRSFRFQSSFKTWIYRVTANCAINYSKKISKERNRTVEYDENLNPLETPDEAGTKIDREDREVLVHSLLKTLNPDQRACLALRNLEGLSYQEIAESLNININTVRSRLKRGREALLSLRKEAIANGL